MISNISGSKHRVLVLVLPTQESVLPPVRPNDKCSKRRLTRDGALLTPGSFHARRLGGLESGTQATKGHTPAVFSLSYLRGSGHSCARR